MKTVAEKSNHPTATLQEQAGKDTLNLPDHREVLLHPSSVDRSPVVAAQRMQIESAFGAAIQRQSLEEEAEEPLQGKFATLPRQPLEEEEEELLQGKFTTGTAPILQKKPSPNRTGLPDELKAGFEHLSGLSLDHVRVHYNSSKPAELQALAYTQGSDIHVAPGQERHVPHEAWHAVQQRQGRVKPTTQMQEGVPVNDDEQLEHEAGEMGKKALQPRSMHSVSVQLRRSQGIIQCLFSEALAREFIRSNLDITDWPDHKPASLWSWFRGTPAMKTLAKHPRWSADEEHQGESQAVIIEQLEGRWAAVDAERKRAAAAEELRLAKEDAETRVTATLRKHVFKGDFAVGTENPTGFHSTIGASTTHKAYGTKTSIDEELGTYQQSVKGKKTTTWVKKGNQSSFFPDTIEARPTKQEDVILALGTAMASSTKTVKYPAAWRGMTIRKLGETWFPAGGDDDLTAE